MKRHKFKRLVAACMLGVFSISCGLFRGGKEALASDAQPKTGSITIQNAIEGATYNFYRIADLKLTNSGDPEDGVSYTMSAEQYYNYSYITGDYDWVLEQYKYYLMFPEDWDEQTEGCDYKTGMKIFEENLSSPVYVTGVHGKEKVILSISESSIDEWTSHNILEAIDDADPDYSFKVANGEIIADDLPFGYYIIVPAGKYETAQNTVIPINLTNVFSDKIVKSKASPLSITKSANITNASVGDVIEFTITGTIPSYYRDSSVASIVSAHTSGIMYIADTMEGMELTGNWALYIDGKIAVPSTDTPDITYESSNLVWNNPTFVNDIIARSQASPEDFESILIHGDKENEIKSFLSDITLPTAGVNSFCLPYFVLSKKDHGKPFEFVYSVVVTDDSSRGSKGNKNNAMTIYFDETSDGTSYEIYSAEDQETVYTYDINLLKYADGDTSKVLPGAQFALYKQDEDGNKPKTSKDQRSPGLISVKRPSIGP